MMHNILADSKTFDSVSPTGVRARGVRDILMLMKGQMDGQMLDLVASYMLILWPYAHVR